MTGVVHFEIHASEPERVAAFYKSLFGWETRSIPALDYWMFETGEGGVAGGMLRRRGPRPAEDQAVNAFVCSVAVDSAQEAHAKALAAGGATAIPLRAIPGVGWQVYIKDPDGNILGLHQADPSAR